MHQKIVIASALDQGFSDKAIKAANALIAEHGSIVAVHVMEPVNNLVQSLVPEDVKSKAYASVKNEMMQRFKGLPIEFEILHGQPGREIANYAEKINADCIILGSHKPGLEDFFLGSTASRVVRYAKCSVYIIRQ
ncbi:MAG: universal stress protein [Thiothrix nivea]|nr:MAG: universal stress protein [Thiothrix nivea]